LANRNDPLHQAIRTVLRDMKQGNEPTFTTLQNISEFWNVCTRPSTARGGLGLSVEQTERRLRLLERLTVILPDPPRLYESWRSLVVQYRVLGVEVHDAKLVAAMKLNGISQILTLNARDFARYPGIVVLTPK
jgi:predicted nucleic acid-binding protein